MHCSFLLIRQRKSPIPEAKGFHLVSVLADLLRTKKSQYPLLWFYLIQSTRDAVLILKPRNHKEKVKSYIMGTLRNAFQVRVAQSCAPLRRMINYVKFAPWLVSVVLVTALASGLQWLTPSLRKRSAQNHPTWIGCACSSLAPLSPLPSTQP